MKKSCLNCRNNTRYTYWGLEPCGGFEMADPDDYESYAEECEQYEPTVEDDDEPYTRSATAGDYGPGNPWDAPGMSIRDFI